MIYSYIPWSKQGKKRSITQSRYGASSVKGRPQTAGANNSFIKPDPHLAQMEKKDAAGANQTTQQALDEEAIQRFNENHVETASQGLRRKGPQSFISARSVVSRGSQQSRVILQSNAVNGKFSSDTKSRVSLANQERPKTSQPFSRAVGKALNNSDAQAGNRHLTSLNLAEAIEKLSEKELSQIVDRVINLNASQPMMPAVQDKGTEKKEEGPADVAALVVAGTFDSNDQGTFDIPI